MDYRGIRPHDVLKIEEIFSIHYFEYMSDFYFSGESHDFWEFLCVDKGAVDVYAGDRFYSLKKGDIIFHKPNEFHNVKANGEVAPNLVVMSFSCTSPAMSFFEEKVLKISESERVLLGQIIQEARGAFDGRINDPYLEQLIRAEDPPFACEHLIRIYLEQLLIQMIRRYMVHTTQISPPIVKSIKQKADGELFNQVLAYMEEHIRESISIEQICRSNSVGRSQLQKLFRTRSGFGAIEYFSRMKIDLAKQMIRENHYNFTQIADALGFSSIHYFSRQFKRVSGMTPSEYASSIQLLSDRPR
ncbi:MAG: helix-turn-helix transcriptional regulator [Clostridiales bacterium]|nr:helix-turn-helix transcriptional regulator [Clostridiales bacterium]